MKKKLNDASGKGEWIALTSNAGNLDDLVTSLEETGPLAQHILTAKWQHLQ